jgi:predicted alpha/beta-fold hydrolase
MDKFEPAWWLQGSHLQTMWPSLFRPKKPINPRTERLELPDGDFLDLSWVGGHNGPLVLILHGLNGGIDSHYVNGIMHAIASSGGRSVLMHFRGCSGVPNRLPRSYHSGETGDLNTVIRELVIREPNTPIHIVGYSLGGNVLLKALGEGLPSNINSAVAVSIPFELAKTADNLCHGFSQIYQRHLVKGLVQNHIKKFTKIPSPIDFGPVETYTTFWEFDDAITAPLHGFKSAADYYAQSSSRQYLSKIQIPTLIIHSRDDPFTTACSIPQPHELSANVQLELTNAGGHVGFVADGYPCQYWLEGRILSFLK